MEIFFSMCIFHLCVGKATDFGNVPRKLGVPGCLRQPVGLSAIPLSLQPPHFVAVAAFGLASIPNAFFIYLSIS